ncbi:20beta-hydroxysteroid dehydrogenase [Fusarium mexicanum]|uniref:20beta-hydroxysteroid dehydrogenase n=1 Tax=Fusarium mexicanum TaxID=751941 RepID=A0A8H5JGA8_9HYPO|nr:20beta-hydroxysteroid dehydrogenase [Fusarium mexicanum]
MTPRTPEKAFSSGVAVITGAGGGLGSGLARHIASFGMTVIIADIDLQRAEEVASDIVAAKGKAEARAVDVSRPGELDELAEYVHTRYGDVQLLINNAAIETLGPLWELSSSRCEATLNINIHGPIHGVRAFLPHMIASGKECWIANVSSVGAFTTIPGQSAYAVTKHAVQAFTESLHVELSSQKTLIHVSSVIPGLLNTGIFDRAKDDNSLAVHLDWEKHRKSMAELAREKGMGIDDASRIIVEQIAEGRLWVCTHPAILTEILQQRIQYYKGQGEPNIPPT